MREKDEMKKQKELEYWPIAIPGHHLLLCNFLMSFV